MRRQINVDTRAKADQAVALTAREAVASGHVALSAATRRAVRDGRLKAPSPTPNSVSSQAALMPDHPQRAYASIDPLPFKAGGTAASMKALEAVLNTMPGMTIVEQRPDYLYAQAQTRWLKFVDDLEFWANPASGVIELRSASRLGREDFGVNRQRIEKIRAAYLAAP